MPKILTVDFSTRIINVPSWGHFSSDIRFDNPGFKNGKNFSEVKTYGQSKTGNVLFSVEPNQKLNFKGIKSFCPVFRQC
jgi:hypothetical protein